VQLLRRRMVLATLLLTFATSGAAADSTAAAAPESSSASPVRNGFPLAEAAVPAEQIRAGGPPRDGIRSVDEPGFAAAGEASWVRPGTPVIGVEIAGDARAYPVHLLEYHQIVNDDFSGRPVVVTYDPLTGSPLVFEARVDGRHLHFGVSGLLYESNFLLYDRETESLWSQLREQAISGPMKGTRLARIRSRQEAFAVWQHRYPDTRVLERPARLDYRQSPFSEYWVSEKIPHPVSTRDDRFHPKAGVLGVVAGGKARAYLGPVLTQAGGRIVDDFEGRKIRIAYDSDEGVFSWEIPDDVEVTDAYWFAWKTFHPATGVWSPEGVEAD